jgi:hypothetical protein
MDLKSNPAINILDTEGNLPIANRVPTSKNTDDTSSVSIKMSFYAKLPDGKPIEVEKILDRGRTILGRVDNGHKGNENVGSDRIVGADLMAAGLWAYESMPAIKKSIYDFARAELEEALKALAVSQVKAKN